MKNTTLSTKTNKQKKAIRKLNQTSIDDNRQGHIVILDYLRTF